MLNGLTKQIHQRNIQVLECVSRLYTGDARPVVSIFISGTGIAYTIERL